jgi:rubredoxin
MLSERLKQADYHMNKYKCVICGYVYDPEEGDPDSGIEPGIEFSDLPADYICPVCGAGKEEFGRIG